MRNTFLVYLAIGILAFMIGLYMSQTAPSNTSYNKAINYKNTETVNTEIDVSGIGHYVSITKNAELLDISGNNNEVRIISGISIKTVSISGIDNVLFVEDGATVDKIDVSGIRCTVSLPRDLEVEIDDSGIDTRIIHRT